MAKVEEGKYTCSQCGEPAIVEITNEFSTVYFLCAACDSQVECTECRDTRWLDKKTYNEFGKLNNITRIECPSCSPLAEKVG